MNPLDVDEPELSSSQGLPHRVARRVVGPAESVTDDKASLASRFVDKVMGRSGRSVGVIVCETTCDWAADTRPGGSGGME